MMLRFLDVLKPENDPFACTILVNGDAEAKHILQSRSELDVTHGIPAMSELEIGDPMLAMDAVLASLEVRKLTHAHEPLTVRHAHIDCL